MYRVSSWDVVELSQRVLNFDESGLWIGQSALRGELYTLRLCNRLSSMLIVAPSSVCFVMSHFPQILTSILDKYVTEWMGEDAVDGLCFHLPKVQSYACFDLPMNRVGFPRSSRMVFAKCESSKTPR